jgi:hypothetical protein
MNSRPEIVAGWTARRTNLEDGVRQILEMLRALQTCLPFLEQWCYHSPPFSAMQVDLKGVAEGVKYHSRQFQSSRELGWCFGAWCEPNNMPFGITVFFGSSSAILGNRATLALPSNLTIDKESLACLLKILVLAWKPDWAAVNPKGFLPQRNFQLGEVTFLASTNTGWMEELGPCYLKSTPFADGHIYDLEPGEIERLYLLLKCRSPKTVQ